MNEIIKNVTVYNMIGMNNYLTIEKCKYGAPYIVRCNGGFISTAESHMEAEEELEFVRKERRLSFVRPV